MLFSKPQVNFFQTFNDYSVSWNITLYCFRSKGQKRDQSKCKCFRLFSAWIKIHQILSIFETKNWFFFKFCTTLQYHETEPLCTILAKVLYTFTSDEEWWRVKTLKSDAKFEEKLTFKYDMRNLVNFHPTTQISENFTISLLGYFFPKSMRFELKKYREVIFHDTERWCKTGI